MKMLDIRFPKKEPTSKFKNKNSVSVVRFSKNRLQRFGEGFSCLIHNSSCSMIGLTVKVFFFMPYLCTSSSESLWLTISQTTSAGKYVISSIIPQRGKWLMASTLTDECRPNRTETRKASCRWQTCATLAKRLHGLCKSSGVVSCIASLPIDSLPMVSY